MCLSVCTSPIFFVFAFLQQCKQKTFSFEVGGVTKMTPARGPHIQFSIFFGGWVNCGAKRVAQLLKHIADAQYEKQYRLEPAVW